MIVVAFIIPEFTGISGFLRRSDYDGLVHSLAKEKPNECHCQRKTKTISEGV